MVDIGPVRPVVAPGVVDIFHVAHIWFEIGTEYLRQIYVSPADGALFCV